MEWQPIETAPRDGAHVIVAEPTVGINSMFFVGEAWFDSDGPDSDDGCWWPANVHPTDYVAEAIYPTHWMPLPAPPKEAA